MARRSVPANSRSTAGGAPARPADSRTSVPAGSRSTKPTDVGGGFDSAWWREHLAFRRNGLRTTLTQRGFTPERIAALEPLLDELWAQRVLVTAAGDGTVSFTRVGADGQSTRQIGMAPIDQIEKWVKDPVGLAMAYYQADARRLAATGDWQGDPNSLASVFGAEGLDWLADLKPPGGGGTPVSAVFDGTRPGSGGAGGTSDPTTIGGANGDGYALFKQAMAQFGITVTDDLMAWAKGLVTRGATQNEILIEFRARPEHKARFGVFHKLAGTQFAISEAEQLATEEAYRSLMRAYGLPEGFWDQPEDFEDLMVKRVSPTELRDRLEAGVEDLYNADPVILDELARRGLTVGESLAGYLNPDRALPALEKAQRASRIGAEARRTQWGMLGLETAADLDAIGVTQSQAREGFSTLARESELFTGLTGTNETGISQRDQVGAQFLGDATARRAIERRRRQRLGVFEAGGGVATGRDGVVGLSSAAS